MNYVVFAIIGIFAILFFVLELRGMVKDIKKKRAQKKESKKDNPSIEDTQK